MLFCVDKNIYLPLHRTCYRLKSGGKLLRYHRAFLLMNCNFATVGVVLVLQHKWLPIPRMVVRSAEQGHIAPCASRGERLFPPSQEKTTTCALSITAIVILLLRVGDKNMFWYIEILDWGKKTFQLNDTLHYRYTSFHLDDN